MNKFLKRVSSDKVMGRKLDKAAVHEVMLNKQYDFGTAKIVSDELDGLTVEFYLKEPIVNFEVVAIMCDTGVIGQNTGRAIFDIEIRD